MLLVGSGAPKEVPLLTDRSGVDFIFDSSARGVFFTVQKGIQYLAKGATLGVVVPDQNDARAQGMGAKGRAAIRSFVKTWRQKLPRRDIGVREFACDSLDFR